MRLTTPEIECNGLILWVVKGGGSWRSTTPKIKHEGLILGLWMVVVAKEGQQPQKSSTRA